MYLEMKEENLKIEKYLFFFILNNFSFYFISNEWIIFCIYNKVFCYIVYYVNKFWI